MKKTYLIPSMAFLALLSVHAHAGGPLSGDDKPSRKKTIAQATSGKKQNSLTASSAPLAHSAPVITKSVQEVRPPSENTFLSGMASHWRRGHGLLREQPAFSDAATETNDTVPFKPSVQVGAIVHMFASTSQSGFGPGGGAGTDWQKGVTLYRARVLVGGQLSKKGSFFMETDLPSPVGGLNGDGTKNVKVSQIILDAQYEHAFCNQFNVIAGLQLVSHNRNGLQGAAALMANDFTFFQYPYNLFANSPLQGNFGRDLGVNFRGFFLKDKFEYRLGMFTGRRFSNSSPFRVVGRVVYNFLDAEKDFYYAGTKLGNGKTIALGAGFDAQTTYSNVGADLFIDVPLGSPGSLTLNSAFTYMSGGSKPTSQYSFAGMIPSQTVQFAELGYYFKAAKLQPWLRFENQAIGASKEQAGGMSTADFNKLNSATVFGGGLNYFFNGYGTNVRLSYTTFTKGVQLTPISSIEKKTFGQLWLQLQFFIF